MSNDINIYGSVTYCYIHDTRLVIVMIGPHYVKYVINAYHSTFTIICHSILHINKTFTASDLYIILLVHSLSKESSS